MPSVTVELPEDVYESLEIMTDEQGYDTVEDSVASIISMNVQPFDVDGELPEMDDDELIELLGED